MFIAGHEDVIGAIPSGKRTAIYSFVGWGCCYSFSGYRDVGCLR